METEEPQGLDIKRLIDVVLGRKALIVSCILSALTIGLAVYLLLPKLYQGTALLTYQQSKINPAQMSPDEQTDIKDIVSTLAQIVTSRTNLEKIINAEGLYKEERERLPMEDVVAVMQENISITPSKTGDTFVVAFEATNPEKVGRVTNTLAAGFIEENLKYREEKATETSAYTQGELEMAKAILDKKEVVMRDYKLKYYNEMPEQQAANMARLADLQLQYQGRQESIQDLERTRVLIRDQLAVRKQLLAGANLGIADARLDNKQAPIETDQMKLARLQNELQGLQGRYTELHPRIKSLKKTIAQLEQTIAQGGSSAGAGDAVPGETFDTTLFDLQTEIKGIGLNIEKINKEKENIQTLIRQYEQWIAATPVREAEWSALTREYSELKRHYDFLVSQNLQAGSALNLERKQKGSQFKIVDSARTPIKPVKPNFLKMMAIALMLGCGLGGGAAIGLNMLDSSFRDPTKLAQTFGLEVICSVPHLPLQAEVSRKRIWALVGTLFFFVWGSAIVVGLVYFYQQGQIVI
ncbi:GumC family protein [Desulfocastanea catecholica]